MSLYTSVIVHPTDPAFQASENFIKELLDFFGVNIIEIASGRNFTGDDDADGSLFFLKNISLGEALAVMHEKAPNKTHFCLPYAGSLRDFADSVSKSIPKEVAGDFLPWDTGITIGPWEAHDYDTDEVLASGSFCITKSANGCPPGMTAYLERLNASHELQSLIAFLVSKTGCKWEVTIELT